MRAPAVENNFVVHVVWVNCPLENKNYEFECQDTITVGEMRKIMYNMLLSAIGQPPTSTVTDFDDSKMRIMLDDGGYLVNEDDHLMLQELDEQFNYRLNGMVETTAIGDALEDVVGGGPLQQVVPEDDPSLAYWDGIEEEIIERPRYILTLESIREV